jgi:hypothetical protein
MSRAQAESERSDNDSQYGGDGDYRYRTEDARDDPGVGQEAGRAPGRTPR